MHTQQFPTHNNVLFVVTEKVLADKGLPVNDLNMKALEDKLLGLNK